MTLKRLLTVVALLAIMTSALALASPVSADSGRSDVAHTCKVLDESGFLEFVGHTRGECVNQLSGPASENANNFLAAFCGFDFAESFYGSKGQCIKALRE